MITLSDFEKYAPYKIWMRGEEYYDSGAVADLEEYEPGEWTAQVWGTDEYEVGISLNGQKVTSWHCDCPYDGEVCKHVVAVVLAIRNNESKVKRFVSADKAVNTEPVITKSPKNKFKKDAEVEKLLSFVEPQQLSQFMLEYASSHPDCKKALLAKFLPPAKNANTPEKDYKIEIQLCFDASSYYGKSSRYSRYHEPTIDWVKVFNKIEGYLTKATLLAEQHSFKSASSIALQILKSIGENYIEEDLIYMDDLEVNLQCENAGDLLLEIVEHPEAPQTLKLEILKDLRQIEKISTYQAYEVYDISLLIDEITLHTLTKEETLMYINQLIEEQKDRWDLHRLIIKKADILYALNRDEEAEKLIKAHLYLPEIRRQKVEHQIECKHYDEAINLLNEGIHIAEKENHPGIIKKWKETLLSIYEKTDNQPLVVEVCKELFINERGSINYYHKLKKLIPSKEWKVFLNTLMAQTHFDTYWSGQNNKADIYVAEKEYESLMTTILETTPSYQLEYMLHYACYLKETHSPKLLALFSEKTYSYAELNVGRNHYEYIARILKEMKKLEGGNAVVKAMVEKFKVMYKRRPAMIEILCEF